MNLPWVRWEGSEMTETNIFLEQQTQIADLQRQLRQAQEKLANWEPWMSALGRMLTEHRIARFPNDVLAWRKELDVAIKRAEAAEALLKRGLTWRRLTIDRKFQRWIADVDVIFTPAEALRAKHRSPQSGQARREGDDDD